MKPTFTVGQQLWYVPREERIRNRGYAVQVAKVGRDWVHLSDNIARRMNPTTMEIDGGGYTSPGRCWLSEADYRMSELRLTEWCKLRATMPEWREQPPPHLSLDDLRRLIDMVKGSAAGDAMLAVLASQEAGQ